MVKLIHRKSNQEDTETMETFLNCQNKKTQQIALQLCSREKWICLWKPIRVRYFLCIWVVYHRTRTLGADVGFRIASSPANCLQAKVHNWPDFFKLMRQRTLSYLFMCHGFQTQTPMKKNCQKTLLLYPWHNEKHCQGREKDFFLLISFPMDGGCFFHYYI